MLATATNHPTRRHRNHPALLVLPVLLLPAAAPAAAPGPRCESKAAAAMRVCTRSVARQTLRCYQQTGAACLDADTRIVRARAKLESKVLAACPDGATMAAAGYPALLTPAALVDRLQEVCGSAPASLAARSFGGPHAAVRQTASTADRSCLDYAYGQGRKLIDYALKQRSACLKKAHGGGACDVAGVEAKIAARETKAATGVQKRCASLSALIGLDPTLFAARATKQTGCAVAASHGTTAPLSLDCGPRAAVPVPAPATNIQVVLPFATWGTRCGDGSDYAFRMRLAPSGQPAGNVVVFMEGGGGCYDGPGCASVFASSPDRFEALSDALPGGGIMSNSASTNPFRDWTKVFLPYCTQDLHIGGGITNAFPEITVQRYGAINTRTALSYVRDVLWGAIDAAEPEGFRPDRLKVLLSGSSAGGYGTAYNYHWVLDDLRWIHTTAAPDAALGMDNGTLGVIALGAVAVMPVTPGWNTLPFMPPYCTTPACAEIFTNLEAATAPRLKIEAEQQILNVSNQVDSTQRNTTLFATMADFVNTARASYCDIQGTPGVRSFLRASSTSIHGQITTNNVDQALIGGTLLRDWLGDAMSAPDAVIDKIAEGDLQTTVPGVNAFPCAVGSPSGAFVDG
jgi:hypothetical protein